MQRWLLVSALAVTAITTDAIANMRGDTAISPDGRWRVSIRTETGEGGASGAAPSSLWLTDLRTGQRRLLFRGRASQDPKRDTVSIAAPRWSLDGGYVYVEADAYATSPAIHQVNAKTGAERYVIDGGLYGVLRTGPWRGYLIVGQHRYHRDGNGSYDPTLVYRPDGKQIAVVTNNDNGGDAAIEAWLRAKGWRAS